MVQDAAVNSDASTVMDIIGERVARTQAKYHRWAGADRQERFGDLFNLVSRPDYLLVAWEHVAGVNAGRILTPYCRLNLDPPGSVFDGYLVVCVVTWNGPTVVANFGPGGVVS